ncbi:hypothetical protein F4779DRAFT_70344 [Xylariaceae sp. FL0662B]|nr:hypothetical protein F4779DRAFT_70344 [Xylariaceae sp. FL0662B]
MDHFNATVFNGSMIATRRGFQVTKHKHRGTAFVNSSAYDSKKHKQSPKPAHSLPIRNTQFTFITNGEDEAKLAVPKRRTGRSKSPSEKVSGSGIKTSKKLMEDSPRSRQSSYSSSLSSEDRSKGEPYDGFKLENDDTNESLRSLPAWASYKLPEELPESYRRLLFMCLAFAPDNDCQFDQDRMLDNDLLDGPEKYVWLVQDPTSLHCAITLGALFDALKSGKRDTPSLLSLSSQLSFIINRRLNEKTQSERVRNITIHAVATLAILAGYLAKHDHWHVHMSGLLRLIDLAGGQHKLDVQTVTTIRKADFVGAVSAATKPCIPFIRRQVPLSCPDSVVNQGLIARDLGRHLLACGLQRSVVDTITGVAGFNACVSLPLGLKGTFRFDPEVAMEHYYFLGYKLLMDPEPLRQFDEVVSPTTTQNLAMAIPSNSARTMRGPTDGCAKSIESAMRILTLMYIREPTFNLPCRETILSELLEECLRDILNTRRTTSSSESLIDPLLLQDSNASQRPTLIWICLATDLLSTAKTVSPGDSSDLIDRPSTYQELLQSILGPEASANLDLVSEDDLEVCRLLDLRCLGGQGWDARKAMKHILGVVKQE